MKSRGPIALASLSLAALAGFAVLTGLGLWQLSRLSEKEAFLSNLSRAAQAAPYGDWSTAPVYARVRVTGLFQGEATSFVRATLPPVAGGLGVYVLTPLTLPDGRVVIVNRGFVPTSADGRPPQVSTPSGPQTVMGFRRPAEMPNWFSPDDRPEQRLFAVRDPRVIAGALQLANVESDFIEAERSGDSGPVGVDAAELIARIPNNHLQYALTWFGLAATLLGVYAALVIAWRRERRRGKGDLDLRNDGRDA